MKNKLLALTLSAISLFTFAGAGCGDVVEEFDPDKTQIFVTNWNGGFGEEWAVDLKNQFNAVNDKYEIILRHEKQNATEVINEIKNNASTKSDIYFNAYTDFQSGIYQNVFEDLSDVLLMEPDGAGTGTVKDKMLDYDSWKKVASKYGEGLYMLPWDEAITGLVFDYKLFVENGWLQYADSSDAAAIAAQGITYSENAGILYFVSSTGKTNYAAGDVILKAGKDGKFGTYDDGQPKTVAEFDDMLNDIANGDKQAKTFLYNGKNDNYTANIMQAAMAQYMGIPAYKAYFTYDSGDNYMAMHDGSSEKITLENGYKVYRSEGVYQGLSFIDKYFNAPEIDPNSKKTSSYSHTDAQNDYILSYTKYGSTGFPAMLVEGTWWENEARAMFNQVSDSSRTFGKVEYRYMLIPKIDGQALADNKTAVETSENGAILVAKTEDEAKLAKIKEFILLSLTDANLKKFTQLSGGFKPYKYDLTETELNSLTPFIRNAWEIYHDKTNIELLRTKVDKFTDPFIFTTTATIYTVPIKEGAGYVVSPIRTLRNRSVDDLFSSPDLGYTQTEWNNFIATAKQQGFFK